MRGRLNINVSSNLSQQGAIVKALFLSGVLIVTACASTDAEMQQKVPNMAIVTFEPDAGQQIFKSPEDAVNALIAATRDDQTRELKDILGANSGELIHSGDPVADKEIRERFVSSFDKSHEIKVEQNGQRVLVVGEDDWPMPIPLVRASNGWWFDTTAGEQEILNRRIGRNELNVIATCRTYVEAQREYANLHVLDGSQHEFAQRFQSSKGQHNGLYWAADDGQQESPLGPLFASASAEGYAGKVLSKLTPYQGYYYRILKEQGAHASGGAVSYVVNGHMTGGFALIAFPARYGDSGVMTFIVNQYGIVYEKNLGPDTADIARSIKQYDPDMSWHIVRD
jgi:hypothetical protein